MTREQVLDKIYRIALQRFNQNPRITWDQFLLMLNTATDDEKDKFIEAVNAKDVKRIVHMYQAKIAQVVELKAQAIKDKWDNDTNITLEEIGDFL